MMTYTSDLQLRALGLKPLADIPNRAGFALILRTRSGQEIPGSVIRGNDGAHYCNYDPMKFSWYDFIGWRAA